MNEVHNLFSNSYVVVPVRFTALLESPDSGAEALSLLRVLVSGTEVFCFGVLKVRQLIRCSKYWPGCQVLKESLSAEALTLAVKLTRLGQLVEEDNRFSFPFALTPDLLHATLL